MYHDCIATAKISACKTDRQTYKYDLTEEEPKLQDYQNCSFGDTRTYGSKKSLLIEDIQVSRTKHLKTNDMKKELSQKSTFLT